MGYLSIEPDYDDSDDSDVFECEFNGKRVAGHMVWHTKKVSAPRNPSHVGKRRYF